LDRRAAIIINHEDGFRQVCPLFPKVPLCFLEAFEGSSTKMRVFLPVSQGQGFWESPLCPLFAGKESEIRYFSGLEKIARII
jgi:hypothetical protein